MANRSRLAVLLVTVALGCVSPASATERLPVIHERTIDGNTGAAYRLSVEVPTQIEVAGEGELAGEVADDEQAGFGAWLLDADGELLGTCRQLSYRTAIGWGGTISADARSCGGGRSSGPVPSFHGEAIFDIAPGVYILVATFTSDRPFTGRLRVRSGTGTSVATTVDGAAFHFGSVAWSDCATLAPNIAMAGCVGHVEVADRMFGGFDAAPLTSAAVIHHTTPTRRGIGGVQMDSEGPGAYRFTVGAAVGNTWAYGADIPLDEVL